MGHRYVATAQEATGVNHCCIINVQSTKYLVLARGTRLETYGSDMQMQLKATLNGTVGVMVAYRPPGEDRDLILIVTEHRRCLVLRLETEKRSAVRWTTRKKAVDLTELSAYRLGGQYLAAVEESMPVAACMLYDGIVHVVNVTGDREGVKKPKHDGILFRGRLSIVRALAMCFLTPQGEEPVLAVLHDDGNNGRHVTTFLLSLRSRTAKPGPLEIRDLDRTAHLLLPIAMKEEQVGLVVGEREVCSFDQRGKDVQRVPIPTGTAFTAACDAGKRSKYFLGDAKGRIHVAFFINDKTEKKKKCRKPTLQTLGTALDVDASCLGYLGDRKLFVGATGSDTKVATLASTEIESLAVVAPNLGPVVAMCVAETPETEGQVVACCGKGRAGSLRVLRQGVDVTPVEPSLSRLQDKHLRGLWCLDVGFIATFVRSSISLDAAGRDLDIPLDPNARTLHCCTFHGDPVVVATSGIYCRGSAKKLSATVAASSPQKLVVGGNGWLRVLNASLTEEAQLHNVEPRCVAISANDLVALATWDDETTVRKTSDLATVQGRISDGCTRSLAFLGDDTLVLGRGDGVVVVYGPEDLVQRRRVSLGTTPVRLYSWSNGVFATSDRAATVRLAPNGNPEIAAAHLYDNNTTTSWATAIVAPYPEDDVLVVAASSRSPLRKCKVDRKRGIRASGVSLGEQPRCVCHDPASGLFLVGTAPLDEPTKGGCLRFLRDAEPYTDVKTFQLDDFEEPLVARSVSAPVATPSDDEIIAEEPPVLAAAKKPRTEASTEDVAMEESFVDEMRRRPPQRAKEPSIMLVGTAVPGPEDFEPSAGRVLIFDGAELKASVDVPGAVYDVVALGGDKIAVAVNHAVLIFDSQLEKQLAVYEGFVVALKLAVVSSDHLVVGDLMRSVTVLKLTRSDETYRLDEIGRDYEPNWTTALASVPGEVIVAEASHNLFAARSSDLLTVAAIHLGDLTNAFALGSLATQVATTSDDHNGAIQKPLLFGCASGRIGCVLPVSSDRRNVLEKLQHAIVKKTSFLGDLNYYEFRAFKTEAKISDPLAFLDGDLLETFLDMLRDQQDLILRDLHAVGMTDETVDGIIAELADLAQQH